MTHTREGVCNEPLLNSDYIYFRQVSTEA